MEIWQKKLQAAVTDPTEIAARFHLDEKRIAETVKSFRCRIPRDYYALIREKGDAIYRQCIPDEAELQNDPDLTSDPLGEEASSPVPNIVHRYPDHCLFLVSSECAAYCRFCTRKRKFSGDGGGIDPDHLEPAFHYLEEHREIRDVLVSGGDPFLLPDERIEMILRRLRAIAHLEIIRIGTRTPCTLPERITRKLAALLKQFHPLYINVHFNHPDEVTPAAQKALNRLADAGIPLGSQTVLLKGVNDTPEIMKDLMQKLLRCRVKPYYLFQSDLINGNSHFRVPLKKGLEIMDALRCWTSGLAVPDYAIDLPGGGGKVILVPDHLVKKRGKRLTFRNYCGKCYDYPDAAEK